MKKPLRLLYILVLPVLIFVYNTSFKEAAKPAVSVEKKLTVAAALTSTTAPATTIPLFDTADYNKKMLELSNYDTTGKWPVKTP